MSVATQTTTPSFVDPPFAGLRLISDVANSKTKVAAYLTAPAAGAPALGTINLLRRTGAAAFAALLADLTQPMTINQPSTATALTYRQCPNFGLARNLVTNGATVNAHGWTLPAQHSIIVDATSPTGFALRLVSTGAYQATTQLFPVEAGKAYSFAFQGRSDGTAIPEMDSQWLDGAGNVISTVVPFGTTGAGWNEVVLANQVAPGNAKTVRINPTTAAATGIVFITAIRVMQQAGAPAAWAAAHQQFIQRGVSVYEAGTNAAADGDMEAVGTASYSATGATLTKDTVTFFAGAKSLKVASTGVDGNASQAGALAAGQAITASIRAKGGDATCRMILQSTPSNAAIGAQQFNPNTTDWNTLRVSGTIAGGDTGWKVTLVAGANTVVAYFDNLAVENKAYDTMNADASGQAFALASRTQSALVIPVPAKLDSTTEVCFLAVVRCDAANATRNSEVLALQIDANNYVVATLNGTQPQGQRGRAGVGVTTAVGAGIANGDTVAIAVRWRAGVGLSLYWAANGGSVTQVNATTEEAKLAPAGAPTGIRVGGTASSLSLDGTVAIVRILAAGLSDAQISAFVSNPYGDPTDNDLAVWLFEGQGYQLPVVDDRLIALGTSYDYRGDVNGTGASPATSTGQVFSAATAAQPTSWWLRSQQDPTKDITFYVLDQHKYKVLRAAQVIEPASGGLPSVIYTGAIEGISGQLGILGAYTTAAQQALMEKAFRTLLGSNDSVFLLSPFGGLFKVRFPSGVELALHEQFLDVTLDVAEVA